MFYFLFFAVPTEGGQFLVAGRTRSQGVRVATQQRTTTTTTTAVACLRFLVCKTPFGRGNLWKAFRRQQCRYAPRAWQIY